MEGVGSRGVRRVERGRRYGWDSSKPPSSPEIGRAHVWTPVTLIYLVCRLLLEKKKKTHHKYIAIVQADGDSIGEIIKQVAVDKEGSKKIREFSKALSGFSLLAAQEIAKYRGIPVYTGGDDLLFFAPVTNGKENIFQLIEKLDVIFEEQVTKKFTKTKPKASMSYGVSVSYYKFPMHEALNTARDLLFNKAKQKPKNAVAFKLLKHSGQAFETILHKPLDDKFINLLAQDKGLVINSLMYGFDKHKVLLEESLNGKTNAKLENFFENFYNEDIHKKSKDFINDVKELLEKAYTNNEGDRKSTRLNSSHTDISRMPSSAWKKKK